MNSSPPRNSCSIKAIQEQKSDFNLSSPLFLWEHRVGKSLGINHLPHPPLIVFNEGNSSGRDVGSREWGWPRHKGPRGGQGDLFSLLEEGE